MPTSRQAIGIMLFLAMVGSASAPRADTATISSEAIAAAGTEVACLDYQVVGGCLWMTCTLAGCEFDFFIHSFPV